VSATAEHLVIGSGAGGAITAALLAEAGRDVLVLEEGPWVDADDVEPFSLDQMARQYRQGGVTAALGRPPVAYAEGRCAGGSTEVNAGLYHLAGEETLERWRRSHAVDGLTADELAPHAAATREAVSVQMLPGPAPDASLKLVAGAEALGWEALEVPRWYRYDGDRPVKQSMTRTYLPRAQAAGARVRTGVRARRLLLRGDRVAGADTDAGRITAEHVWVCGGAIGSPALLRSSGIRRHVGATLQMHPTVKLVARFAEPLGGTDDVPVHQVKPFGSELSFGGSASRPGFVALALTDDWAANRRLMDQPESMAVYYAAIRPTGRGRVLPLPGLADPLVTFLLTKADLELLGRGMEHLARLLLAAGAESVHPSLAGGGAVTRPEETARLPKLVTRAGASVMTVHLCSSIPMGEADCCPVDSYGKVRGVRNLRVNDASLLPDAPGINPQGTVMAIAQRNVAAHLA
jgi:choline dehydrogenase-like flavoprotein